MDEVTLTRAQIKSLDKRNADVTITAVNGDQGLIYWERTKFRGDRGEGKWMKSDGRDRDGKK